MPTLVQIAPDIGTLQNTSIEDLGWAILSTIRQYGRQTSDNTFARLIQSYQPPLHEGRPFSRAEQQQVREVIAEVMGWLVTRGLVRIEYEGGHTYHVISRLGRSVDTDEKFRNFILASSFSYDLLHPEIRDICWPLFLRGELDTAVFAAFKRVEICAREGAGLGAEIIGVPLMRAAFHKDTGALTDGEALEAEKEAMAHMFAGAVGLFKNPNSHRDVGLGDHSAAAEVLMFASHLLRIIEHAEDR